MLAEFYAVNVRDVLARANESDYCDGLAWYTRARELAAKVAHGDVSKGAGVIAALSPQMPWNRNIELAEKCCKRKRFAGMGQTHNNARKARQIWQGKAPLSVLGGNKTRAFYECIVSAGQTEQVCIDRHAIAVCLGRDATQRERSIFRNTGKHRTLYYNYAEAYRIVARENGMKPSTVQAITWLVWRREKGVE